MKKFAVIYVVVYSCYQFLKVLIALGALIFFVFSSPAYLNDALLFFSTISLLVYAIVPPLIVIEALATMMAFVCSLFIFGYVFVKQKHEDDLEEADEM